MENKITIGERELDRAAELCEALDNAFDATLINPLNAARLAYAKAFDACVNDVADYFGGNIKLAESYVNIARKLRIEDPEGFKARVKAFNGNWKMKDFNQLHFFIQNNKNKKQSCNHLFS